MAREATAILREAPDAYAYAYQPLAYHRLMQVNIMRGQFLEGYANGLFAIEAARRAKKWADHRIAHVALIETEVCMGRLSRARLRLSALNASAELHGDSVSATHLHDLRVFLAAVEGSHGEVIEGCRRRVVECFDKGDEWRANGYLSFQILFEAPTAPIEHLDALVERFVDSFEMWPNDEPSARWAVHWGITALRTRGATRGAERLSGAFERRNQTLLAGLAGASLWDPATLVPRQ